MLNCFCLPFTVTYENWWIYVIDQMICQPTFVGIYFIGILQVSFGMSSYCKAWTWWNSFSHSCSYQKFCCWWLYSKATLSILPQSEEEQTRFNPLVLPHEPIYLCFHVSKYVRNCFENWLHLSSILLEM